MTEAENHCPLCKGFGRKWLDKRGYALQECVTCGHRFYHPASPDSHVGEVYGDQYFTDSAEGYVDYMAEEAIQRASARYYVRRLRPLLPTVAKVLDVGAACGFFLKELQEVGWHGLGIEPNAAMRSIGKDRFELRILDGSLAQLPSEYTFELISAIQVISHLIDPVEFVAQAHTRLSSGGYLLVETWDRDSRVAKLSGASWHELNPPSVLHWFSRASLREMICDAGFEVVACGLPHKRIQLGRAFRMLRHSGDSSALSRFLTWPLTWVPERLSLPYVLGDAFWMLFRKCS
jgi:SAM-dependent methyltransferase